MAALSAQQSGVITRAARNEGCEALSAAIAGLAEEDRALLIMRGLEELDVAEIASRLGLKPNTVSVKYRRALFRLRDIVGRGSALDELPAT